MPYAVFWVRLLYIGDLPQLCPQAPVGAWPGSGQLRQGRNHPGPSIVRNFVYVLHCFTLCTLAQSDTCHLQELNVPHKAEGTFLVCPSMRHIARSVELSATLSMATLHGSGFCVRFARPVPLVCSCFWSLKLAAEWNREYLMEPLLSGQHQSTETYARYSANTSRSPLKDLLVSLTRVQVYLLVTG